MLGIRVNLKNHERSDMKIDAYSRVILTIIAGCLLWTTFIKPFVVTPAQAGAKEVISVNITEVGGCTVWKALPVEVTKE